MVELREINKDNYMECISLKVKDEQVDFVADNAQSLCDACFLEGLNTLGIYNMDKMVGFILYDFDEELGGWSLSRFMIDKKYQGNGLGKKALSCFLDYFYDKIGYISLVACININNLNTISLFEKFDFQYQEEIEYSIQDKVYKEFKYVRAC